MADSLSDALAEFDSEQEPVLVINPEKRTIQIPDDFIFGVFNDKDVTTVPFKIPRYYGTIDFSTYRFTINYVNAAGYGNLYDITDLTIGEEYIEFNWVLGRGVFVAEGKVKFVVCIRNIGEGGLIQNEFNTRVYTADVLQGLEVDDENNPEIYSILETMRGLESTTKGYKDYVEEQSTSLATLTNSATSMLGTANSKLDLANAAINRAEQLYGTPLVAATVAGMTNHDKIYVYTGSETNYTAGNWYYWNGSAWTSGGVYNSTAVNTDTTLTVSGVPADAKAVGDALKADIAPAYSSSSTYSVGDYVLYNNVLYRCKTAISTAENWTAAHWQAVNATSEISSVKADINELDDQVAAFGLSVVNGALCVTYTA